MSEAQTLPISKPQPREVRVVQDEGVNSQLLDTARFEQMQRIAAAMAAGSLTPQHLKGKNPQESASNCLRVVNQAFRWGMDPFAVMDETYVVRGKLAYQGKLVIAVVNARANLIGRLQFEHSGIGLDRTVTVTGHFEGEPEPRTITLSVKQAKTDNDMWVKDPDQKLCYTGATKWARRHCPEVVLGVVTDHDLEMIAGRQQGPQEVHESRSDALVARLVQSSVVQPEAQGEESQEPAAPAGEESQDMPPEVAAPTDAERESSWNDFTGKLEQAKLSARCDELVQSYSVDGETEWNERLIAASNVRKGELRAAKGKTKGALPGMEAAEGEAAYGR